LICGKINRGLAAYLDEHGIPELAQLTGSLRLNDAQGCACE